MTNANQEPVFAMPIGLPATGTDPLAHYAELRANMTAQTTSDNVVHVWTADREEYSGLFAMSKGLLSCVPAGSLAPDGTVVVVPMLVLKTWLWSYLELRKNASSGLPLPKLITYGHVDDGAVVDATRAELLANARYRSLTESERAQAEQDFLAGRIKLLVESGTFLGRGAVDPSPPSGGLTGHRRLDLTFRERDGSALEPPFYFDLWSLISGVLVREHPLVKALRRPLVPAMAPLEGGNRVQVTGDGFSAGTTVTVNDKRAVDIEVAIDGRAVYATLPPLPAGTADVIVTRPGHPADTYAKAITYVSDVQATARAVTLSYAVRLTEIRDRAVALANSGTLDDSERVRLRIEMDIARHAAAESIEARSRAGGGSLRKPGVGATWEDSQQQLRSLLESINAMIA